MARNENEGRRIRACLCWNCGRVNRCTKLFPGGRPRGKGECDEFTAAPPGPTRITHKEMADILGWSVGKIDEISVSPNGVRYLMKALARKGIMLTYEQKNNRLLFYKEEN